MARNIITLIIAFIAICYLASNAQAQPQPFTATYDVYEDGAIKATLTTSLTKTGEQQYRITDITTGTAGLASLLNFRRTEQTDFIYRDMTPEVIHHSMHQKVAFKNKRYEFSHQPGETDYHGVDHKKTFQITSEQPLLSTQLMSWQLAQQVCHNPQSNMQWSILKSTQAKTYYFKIVAVDNHKTLVHRLYPNRPDRSTAIWINGKDCHIEEITYRENKKTVRTVLDNITFQQP
ncbi:MAG: DUF3108 domain-containing protein [Proteobacteria bacterium]|nr:MAG: DUF3108 domain-containing protein [Pseudomonadota bacterium]